MGHSSQKYIGKGLNQKTKKSSKGKIYLIEDRCKGCNLCIEFCPKEVLVESEKFNEKGYHPPELEEIPGEKECVGCGYCSLVCPEFAIFCEVENEEEDK